MLHVTVCRVTLMSSLIDAVKDETLAVLITVISTNAS